MYTHAPAYAFSPSSSTLSTFFAFLALGLDTPTSFSTAAALGCVLSNTPRLPLQGRTEAHGRAESRLHERVFIILPDGLAADPALQSVKVLDNEVDARYQTIRIRYSHEWMHLVVKAPTSTTGSLADEG